MWITAVPRLLITALLITSAGTTAAAEPAKFKRFTYSGKSQEQVTAGPGHYLNPILAGYYPDPSVTQVGSDYYLVNSSFSHFPGVPVFHSRDLVSWTQIGNAIDRPEQLDFARLDISAGVFAPDISQHDGVFYIVSTCIGCKGNFVITATNPAGPWSNPTWFDFEGIDPSIFWDDDGKAWIVNNGAPNETPRYDGHRAIWIQEFDFRNMKLIGERTQLVNGSVDLAQKPIWIEGAYIFRKDGYYYLTAAEGGTGDWHSQVVFRSHNVRGPFVPAPKNPILSQRSLDPGRSNPVTLAGHAKFVQTQNGQWWATFLATRPYAAGNHNIGRETFLLPVQWQDGWPTILDGKAIPFAVARPALQAQPLSRKPVNGDFSYVDEFKGGKLTMEWLSMRTPRAPLYRIDNGALIVQSGTRMGDQGGVPGFVGRRQQHHVAEISTDIELLPSVMATSLGWSRFRTTRLTCSSVLRRRLASGGSGSTLATAQVPNARLHLFRSKSPSQGWACVRMAGRMTFYYQHDGKGAEQTVYSDLDVAFLNTRAADGFVGTLMGPMFTNNSHFASAPVSIIHQENHESHPILHRAANPHAVPRRLQRWKCTDINGQFTACDTGNAGRHPSHSHRTV